MSYPKAGMRHLWRKGEINITEYLVILKFSSGLPLKRNWPFGKIGLLKKAGFRTLKRIPAVNTNISSLPNFSDTLLPRYSLKYSWLYSQSQIRSGGRKGDINLLLFSAVLADWRITLRQIFHSPY
jgi:hypothetical protein